MVSEAIAKQLDEVQAKDVRMDANLAADYEADSVDVVAMLLQLESNFKNELTEAGVKAPMDKLGNVMTVQDLFNLMVDLIKEVEAKKK